MKLTKIIVSSCIALPATVVPLSTLTSCGQSWGRLSPISIGGASSEEGPFKNFIVDTLLDFNNKNYLSYLQSNYSLKQSSGAMYGYSLPKVWNKDDHNWNDDGTVGWYQPGDAVFNSFATYKDEETGDIIESRNAQNATLSSNIAFVSTIGATLNNYLSELLSYQASWVNPNSDANIKTAWGDGTSGFKFIHGDKGTDQNNHYYEYDFALANLNGSQKSQAMLRPSHVGFSFDDTTFPLPSYDFNRQLPISTSFMTLLEHNDITAEDNFKYYSKKDTTHDEYTDYFYDSVPVLVNFDTLSQTYLNPQISGPILVNDYYASDANVRWTIGDMWKDQLSNITGQDKKDCIPHYKEYVLNADGSASISIVDLNNKDERLPDVLEGNKFIALMGYALRIYKDTEEKPTEHEKDRGTITGLQNIFPAYWLQEFGNNPNWFKKVRSGEETEDIPYVINQSTVNHYNNILKGIFSPQRRTKPLSEVEKKLLTFLGYMFADNEKNINTDNFLHPGSEIED